MGATIQPTTWLDSRKLYSDGLIRVSDGMGVADEMGVMDGHMGLFVPGFTACWSLGST